SNSSLYTWEGWARELATDHRVITLDFQGHGLTGPDPEDRYTTTDLVETVHQVTLAKKLDRFALAGNSMGGHVAIAYALAHPGREAGRLRQPRPRADGRGPAGEREAGPRAPVAMKLRPIALKLLRGLAVVPLRLPGLALLAVGLFAAFRIGRAQSDYLLYPAG